MCKHHQLGIKCACYDAHDLVVISAEGAPFVDHFHSKPRTTLTMTVTIKLKQLHQLVINHTNDTWWYTLNMHILII